VVIATGGSRYIISRFSPLWADLQGSMPMRVALVAGFLLSAMAAPSAALAQSVHSSVNIDIMPDHLADGMMVLKDYLAEAKSDRTLESIQLSQRLDAPNHFMLDQRMADKSRYDAHVQAAYVRKFRERLFPSLGSPWDERLYRDVAQ
jgi:quinol monooxygenase YgiN